MLRYWYRGTVCPKEYFGLGAHLCMEEHDVFTTLCIAVCRIEDFPPCNICPLLCSQPVLHGEAGFSPPQVQRPMYEPETQKGLHLPRTCVQYVNCTLRGTYMSLPLAPG